MKMIRSNNSRERRKNEVISLCVDFLIRDEFKT